jgi:hypothetical protein
VYVLLQVFSLSAAAQSDADFAATKKAAAAFLARKTYDTVFPRDYDGAYDLNTCGGGANALGLSENDSKSRYFEVADLQLGVYCWTRN